MDCFDVGQRYSNRALMRNQAPEVGLGLPYNLKADVYSWAMLMWYIMALEPPVSSIFLHFAEFESFAV